MTEAQAPQTQSQPETQAHQQAPQQVPMQPVTQQMPQVQQPPVQQAYQPAQEQVQPMQQPMQAQQTQVSPLTFTEILTQFVLLTASAAARSASPGHSDVSELASRVPVGAAASSSDGPVTTELVASLQWLALGSTATAVGANLQRPVRPGPQLLELPAACSVDSTASATDTAACHSSPCSCPSGTSTIASSSAT